jgi:hypothetical protein
MGNRGRQAGLAGVSDDDRAVVALIPAQVGGGHVGIAIERQQVALTHDGYHAKSRFLNHRDPSDDLCHVLSMAWALERRTPEPVALDAPREMT